MRGRTDTRDGGSRRGRGTADGLQPATQTAKVRSSAVRHDDATVAVITMILNTFDHDGLTAP